MEFFNSAIEVLQTLVVALGAGLGVWGAINLLEGYGNDNPGSKSQGMKQLMAGGGVALVGITPVSYTHLDVYKRQVQQIPIDALHPFTNHPFKVLDDEAMTRTVESIAQYGVCLLYTSRCV